MRISLRMQVACALGVLALASAGGAQAQHIRFTEISGAYDPQDLAFAGRSGRAVPAVVIGNPFAVPPPLTAQAVAEAMRNAHFGPHVTFAAAQGPQAFEAVRVVWLINGSTLTGGLICDRRNPLPLGPGAHSSTHVVATFCRGDSAMTQVAGTIDGVADPRDARFRELVQQMTVNLFPPRSPDWNGDRNDRRGKK